MRVALVSMDLPWHYRDRGNAGKRGVSHKYKTMTIKQMMKIPIDQMTRKNSVLEMWVTWPLLQEALMLMKHYGFKYKTAEFVWNKVYRNGDQFMGLGHGSRSNTEFMIRGIKGKGLKVKNHSIRQVIISTIDRDNFSRKPEEVYKRLDKLYGKTSKVELFATKRRRGWITLGKVLDGMDIVESINKKIISR